MSGIQNVILVGANGKLGPAILTKLHSAQKFKVTVLSRASSKSTYPDYVRVVRVPDEPETPELVDALRGQDAVVVVFAGSLGDLQIRLADAAVQADVKRFIPADFGSCDSSNPRVLDLMKLYRTKLEVRQHLQSLASSSGLSWTSLVCGHFFDYGLKSGLLLTDLDSRAMRVFDGGETRWSATTVDRIAASVARVLEKEKETRNRMLYIQSFCISQNQLLESLGRATGQDWKVEHLKSEDFIAQIRAELDKDPNDGEAVERLVSVMGMIDTNWETKGNFANTLLGFEDEDLDQIVKGVVG